MEDRKALDDFIERNRERALRERIATSVNVDPERDFRRCGVCLVGRPDMFLGGVCAACGHTWDYFAVYDPFENGEVICRTKASCERKVRALKKKLAEPGPSYYDFDGPDED